MARRLCLAAALAAGVSGGVCAAPIASSYDATPGTPLNASALTGFTTTGADMAGTLVTVNFSTGSRRPNPGS